MTFFKQRRPWRLRVYVENTRVRPSSRNLRQQLNSALRAPGTRSTPDAPLFQKALCMGPLDGLDLPRPSSILPCRRQVSRPFAREMFAKGTEGIRACIALFYTARR